VVLTRDNVTPFSEVMLDSAVTAVAVSPRGDAVTAGAFSGTVAVLVDGNWIEGRVDGPITSLAVSDEGRVVVAYQLDGPHTELWKVGSEGLEERIPLASAHLGSIDSIVFHPTRPFFVTGSDDRVIMVWDARDGHLLHRLEGHTDRIWGLGFDPAGKWLVSGSEDSTVRVWAVDDAFRLLGRAIPIGETVLAIAPTSDGVIVSHGDVIEQWDLSTSGWIRRACDLAERSLTESERAEFLEGRSSVGCGSNLPVKSAGGG
jgi:WD40 repeat protein